MSDGTLTERETRCLASIIDHGDGCDFGGRHANKADRKAVEHLIEMGLVLGSYRNAAAVKPKQATKTSKPSPEIIIQKASAVPRPANVERPTRYPFATMPVGGMFFLPDRTTEKFSTYASLWGRKLKRKFQTRTIWRKLDKKTNTWIECEPDDKDAKCGVGVYRVR